jgi:hypothetical protein
VSLQKQHSTGRRLFNSKLDLNLRKKLLKCYTLCTALSGAEIWALRKADQKYLASFEMWCWKKDKEEQLDRSCGKYYNTDQEKRNILPTV